MERRRVSLPHRSSDKFTGRVLVTLPTLSLGCGQSGLTSPAHHASNSAGSAGVRAMKTDRPPQERQGYPAGDEELSRDQWIERFAMRLAMLDDMQHPLELLLQIGNDMWSTYGGVEPEVIADAEYRTG